VSLGKRVEHDQRHGASTKHHALHGQLQQHAKPDRTLQAKQGQGFGGGDFTGSDGAAGSALYMLVHVAIPPLKKIRRKGKGSRQANKQANEKSMN
jgi:hypothetical protein